MKRRGFSLIELMMVVMILSVVMMAVFALISMSLQGSSAEQSKLDIFQEAREFMDMMSRDLRQAGYPNARNVAASAITTALTADTKIAVGIVKMADGELWFEGDVDGSGIVSVVHYYLDASADNGCPCLRRSQQPKIEGNPLEGQAAPVYEVQVQGVRNTDIFKAYSNGAAIALPVDFIDDSNAIARIDTIQATLTLQAAAVDSRTGQRPSTTLVSTVKINNCSHAAVGEILSCH